jgi:hypothetical protein|tara:strand:- start:2072 stop:2332 length:261 start_codon:yes stop_codon:yes gene_type:complete
MKIFFYKSILVFTLFILAVHFSFGIISKNLKNQYSNFASKDSIENMKIKIREELKDGLGEKTLLSAEDAKLINDFLKKVKSELEKN